MHCLRTLILRYYQCNRPVAAWPPPWPIRRCASNLERKFDNCQPSVQALKLVRITLGSGANPRPGPCSTEIRSSQSIWIDRANNCPGPFADSVDSTRERNVVYCRNRYRLCDFARESPKSLPVLAATDFPSRMEWLNPLGIIEAATVKRRCTLYAAAIRRNVEVSRLKSNDFGRPIPKYWRYLRPIVRLLPFCCDCLIATRFDREMHNEGKGE